MSGIKPTTISRKWLVVHGHFYQPPRENPWLGSIEAQESAAPFHDWNERIYAECYRPNAYSRMLDNLGMITGINNNYEYLSYNFGPTLLSWLESEHPVTLSRVVEGDTAGAKRSGGRGNALAQVYNHIIMPLASRKDKLTQIRWAKSSFKRLFKREARGMWLAETAINMETVECLIEERIAFVVLSPNQAAAIKPLRGRSSWTETSSVPIDTRRPYRLFATDEKGHRTGGHLDIFFFDEGLSKEISFNDLLQDAHVLGNRIEQCYTESSLQDEVVVIATDGETFGHHKPFGDMCLAYFFRHLAPAMGIQVVNFDHYRSLHPPKYEVSLLNAFGEGTAWSCAHGVGRWIRDCGCNTGGEPGWNQKWRTPLREALNRLQQQVDDVYVKTCKDIGIDPWELRDWYTDKLHNDTLAVWEKTLRRKFTMPKDVGELLPQLRRLLDAQKYMLYAFTSCGWFFSEISGIEPMQNLAYACRALKLGIDGSLQVGVLESFLADCAAAKSNIGDATGETLFRRDILPHFHTNHSMAFVVAIEKMIGMQSGSVINNYGYTGVVEALAKVKPIREALPQGGGLYRVSIHHEKYDVKETFAVAVTVTAESKPSGFVLRLADTKKMVTFKEVVNHKGVLTLSLGDVFPSLRNAIAEQYLQKIISTSYAQLFPWFASHEEDLQALNYLYPALPGNFEVPVGFVLQEQWNAVFKEFDLKRASIYPAMLVSIHNNIKRYKVAIDYTVSAAMCEELLGDGVGSLLQTLKSDRFDSLCILLDTIDTYALPVSKHRLEDIFYPVLIGPVRDLYQKVKDTPAIGSKKNEDEDKMLLDTLLKFARRMNFNVEALIGL